MLVIITIILYSKASPATRQIRSVLRHLARMLRDLVVLAILAAIVIGAVVLWTPEPPAPSPANSSSPKVARQVAANKLEFMKRHQPQRYDIDAHGAEPFVTYKVTAKNGHILLCRAEVWTHKGKLVVASDSQCFDSTSAPHHAPATAPLTSGQWS
jgi:hypothetical protein